MNLFGIHKDRQLARRWKQNVYNWMFCTFYIVLSFSIFWYLGYLYTIYYWDGLIFKWNGYEMITQFLNRISGYLEIRLTISCWITSSVVVYYLQDFSGILQLPDWLIHVVCFGSCSKEVTSYVCGFEILMNRTLFYVFYLQCCLF